MCGIAVQTRYNENFVVDDNLCIEYIPIKIFIYYIVIYMYICTYD